MLTLCSLDIERIENNARPGVGYGGRVGARRYIPSDRWWLVESFLITSFLATDPTSRIMTLKKIRLRKPSLSKRKKLKRGVGVDRVLCHDWCTSCALHPVSCAITLSTDNTARRNIRPSLHTPGNLYHALERGWIVRQHGTGKRFFMRLASCVMRHEPGCWWYYTLHIERPSEHDYAEASMCCDLTIEMSYKPLQRTRYPAFWLRHSPSKYIHISTLYTSPFILHWCLSPTACLANPHPTHISVLKKWLSFSRNIWDPNSGSIRKPRTKHWSKISTCMYVLSHFSEGGINRW